jgi:hypothetical protein
MRKEKRIKNRNNQITKQENKVNVKLKKKKNTPRTRKE